MTIKSIVNMFSNSLSEIGPGWAPTILNSSLELEFIGRQHMRLSNHLSYWIGGSTSAADNINISDYIKHSPCAGKETDFFS